MTPATLVSRSYGLYLTLSFATVCPEMPVLSHNPPLPLERHVLLLLLVVGLSASLSKGRLAISHRFAIIVIALVS